MPASQPSAQDLFTVVREVLSAEIAPLLPAPEQFRLRMIDRLLEILAREQSLGAPALARERDGLLRLLADPMPVDVAPMAGATRAADPAAPGAAASVDELAAELCRRIRDGRVPADSPALLAHLRQSLGDALRIDNPRWLPPGA